MRKNSGAFRRARFWALSLLLAIFAGAGASGADGAEESPDAERSVARLVERITRMIRRREYADALAAVDRALDIDATYIPLWRLKSLAHLETGRYGEAMEAVDVCLLNDPGDVEANLLALVVCVRRDDLPRREQTARIGLEMERAGPALFSEVLARFAERPDFPEYLSLLLAGWRRDGSPLDSVRELLALFYDCRFDAAGALLAGLRREGIRPNLAHSLAGLIERADNGLGLDLWAADLGTLERGAGGLVLTAEPLSQGFAWLRLSPGWSDVDVRVVFGGAPETAESLYLRYTSSESYLRLAYADGVLTAQERIPGLGLSTVFELPGAPADVRAVLKGDRLTLYAGGVLLTDPPLPVSRPLRAGRLAIACENRSSGRRGGAVFSLGVERLSLLWRRLGRDRAEASAVMDDVAVTGVIVPLDGAAEEASRIPSLLLAAKAEGLTTIAELPDGARDFSIVRRAVAGLPDVAANGIWDVVALRPGLNPDWNALAALAEGVRREGMAAALVLPAGGGAGLAAYPGRAAFDWLLLDGAAAADGLGDRYGAALYRTGPDRYSESPPP